jgi:hypothetical protein
VAELLLLTFLHTHRHIYITLFKLYKTPFDAFDTSSILLLKPTFLRGTSNHINRMDISVGLYSNCWALNRLHRWMTQQRELCSLPSWFFGFSFSTFRFFFGSCVTELLLDVKWLGYCFLSRFPGCLSGVGIISQKRDMQWTLQQRASLENPVVPHVALSSEVKIQCQVPDHLREVGWRSDLLSEIEFGVVRV